MSVRPTPEQVLSLAQGRAAATAATAAADPAKWSGAGCDQRAVWGAYIATSAEPYEVAVDLAGPAFRCSCPSRKVPCKHCLGLLLLHANEAVAPANRLPFVAQWLQRRGEQSADSARAPTVTVPDADGGEEVPAAAERSRLDGTASRPPVADRPEPRRLDRAERMAAGLRELDRWLADRVRGGLASAELADDATWERLAARLVDAQCGGLANRVRRVASKVGQHARWHEDVLEEMAILHALAVGAGRTGHLPADLADGVHAAAGLTFAKDDVLEGVPTTAMWTVVGESRVAEGRITVQRTWLMASDDGAPTWALVLAFGAFGNEVATEYPVGQRLHADVHWYPAAARLRALVGRRHAEPSRASSPPPTQTLAAALAACGWAIAREPWLERFPVCVSVVPAPLGNGRWALVDDTGSVPIVPGFWRLAEIVAASGGRPLPVMGEWSTDGVLPLTVWTDGQVVSL
jgi:hypothetical protein